MTSKPPNPTVLYETESRFVDMPSVVRLSSVDKAVIGAQHAITVSPIPEWASESKTYTLEYEGLRYTGVPVRFRDGNADFLIDEAWSCDPIAESD